MAIIKCKMCGGDLNLIEGASTAECEFCGSVQTIPNLDDEKKLIQFERAERLRKQCEFDKAAGIYETIVADFRQEAEAYWGLVLCKYGIEYVDDPATGKKVPTCHRSSFDSIMEDSDFEQALENADGTARKVYRDEAKAIEEIRKGIIAVSNNEKPYDIFICYKETDENGDRTLDSVLAQDVYDALTGKGYRVFFSRITLEDKLGMEYEPYIFAALNSAKIMLAFGTDYEYFNAVWVKNEWSRFLKLMAKDKEKHLIPCFKGIDAYDMPKEFARLQAQDLGKVGATQDLLRGIEKIIPRQTAQSVVVQERVVVGGSGDNKIASLLDRGNMALEDGDWAKADSFFEDVLNNDSKNAQAYLGKTLAQEKCRTIDAFARKRKDASQNIRGETLKLQPNQAHTDEKAKQFSLPGYVEQSEIRKLYDFDLSYHSDVAERRQQYRNEEKYWADHKQLSRAEKFAVGAVAENLQREKKALFAVLSDRVKKAEAAEATAKQNVQARYEAYLRQADEKAEKLYNEGVTRREKNYQELLQIAKTSSDVEELTETAKKFDAFGSYQDSRKLAEHCRKRAAEEQAKLNAEAEVKRLAREKQEQARKAKNKKIGIISAVAAVIAIVVTVVITQVIIPNNHYNQAIALMENGQYEEAYYLFLDLGNYKNAQKYRNHAKEKKIEADYSVALDLIEKGNYEHAIAYYQQMQEFIGSKEPMNVCYDLLVQQSATLDFTAALDLLGKVPDDYYQEHSTACLIYAERLIESGNWKEIEKYTQMSIAQDDDSKEKALQYSNYAAGMLSMTEGNYSGAIKAFSEIEDDSFLDVTQQAGLAYYYAATQSTKISLADAVVYLEQASQMITDENIAANVKQMLSEYSALLKCEGDFKCYQKIKEDGTLTTRDIGYRVEMSFYVSEGKCFLVFNNSLFHDTKVYDAIVKAGENGYTYKTVHSDSENNRNPEIMLFSQDEVVFTGGPFSTVYYYQRTE